MAVVDDADGRRYRYSDLEVRAVRVAQHLQVSIGVKPGDRVACLSSNRIEYLDLYFACGKLGAVLVPLNFRLPPAGIVELLEDCQAKVLVYESTFADVADALRDAGVVPLPIDANDQTGDQISLAHVLATSELPEPAINVYQADESDTAMILYTSGTTGRPKGAMIPYRQIHWNALNTIIGLQLTQDDTVFLNMPLYHTGGWHVLFTPLMLLGGRVVLQKGFDPERCNQLLGPEGITHSVWRPHDAADDVASCQLFNCRFLQRPLCHLWRRVVPAAGHRSLCGARRGDAARLRLDRSGTQLLFVAR